VKTRELVNYGRSAFKTNSYLLSTKILNAPIQLEDGTIINPTKGTPQGGILSPLLANINLNEFDWWISDQWETAKTQHSFKYQNKEGRTGRDNRALKKTKLKPMYVVRYADDFKIFTSTRINAEKNPID
jgi:retron-type reverse transcriptase